MTLYFYQLDEDTIITHDGYCQLGIYLKMSKEKFLSMVKVEYIEVYWIPDIFTKRYKRTNYQKLLKQASVGTKDDEHLCSQ
jgi:hypothetical protein